MQEILLEGLIALIAGMSTVFSILILISIIISLFRFIKPQNEKVKNSKKSKSDVKNLNTHGDLELVQQNDMNQVVAAISVALAASLDTTVDKLRVMSVRQL